MAQLSSNEVNSSAGNLSDGSDDREPTWDEIRPWAEFCCWTTLIIAPITNLLNGPAVSSDQAVVRTVLIVLAACGGVGLPRQQRAVGR